MKAGKYKYVDEKQFQDTTKRWAALYLVLGGGISLILIVVGASLSNGQVLGFGAVFLAAVCTLYAWEKIKLLILETHLLKHNRILEPSYREMRVSVSNFYLILLRS